MPTTQEEKPVKPRSRSRKADQKTAKAAARAQATPGQESVAVTDQLPLRAQDGNYVYDAEGHPREPRQGALLAAGRTVSPGYFSTLGIGLVRGRLLNDQDSSGASRAVVISEHMAEKLWPNQNPLGKHIIAVGAEKTAGVWDPKEASVVVGVVNNTRERTLASGFGDEVYAPIIPLLEQPVMYVLLRTRLTSEQAAAQIRQAVAEVDPQVPVTRVQTLDEVVAASQSAPRSLTLLLLCFGALAVLIGGVGVYSLIAYIVSWRTREIGIRLALGAQHWQIVRDVVRKSLTLAFAGSVVGLAAAAFTAQLLRSFLFGVRVIDPITFCAVPLLMTAIALAAAWIPARRAASVDPMQTLRME